jgi:hypothetical protein
VKWHISSATLVGPRETLSTLRRCPEIGSFS